MGSQGLLEGRRPSAASANACAGVQRRRFGFRVEGLGFRVVGFRVYRV